MKLARCVKRSSRVEKDALGQPRFALADAAPQDLGSDRHRQQRRCHHKSATAPWMKRAARQHECKDFSFGSQARQPAPGLEEGHPFGSQPEHTTCELQQEMLVELEQHFAQEELRKRIRELEAEIESKDASLLCAICFMLPRSWTLQPCGHFALCRSCASRLPNDRCPMCGATFTGMFKTWLS